jgi:hypothetical protein
MHTPPPASASPGERETRAIALQRMLASPVEAAAISVVAKRGIADLVKEGPRHVNELARATGANVDALYRVLRLTASLGVLEEVGERVFGTTPYAALLEEGEGSLRRLAQNYIEEVMLAATQIDYSVETGLPSYDRIFGRPRFESVATDPEKLRAYHSFMAGRARSVCGAVADAYSFTEHKRIVDVGGSHGLLATTILERHSSQNPSLRTVIFDRPEVIELVTRPRLSGSKHGPYCELVGGNFFHALPADGDLYTFLSIFNDWSDDHCRTILNNCRTALAPGGRLLLIDPVIPAEPNVPHFGKRLDVQMLLVHRGGRLRTEPEIRGLLHSAGFQTTRVIPTSTYLTLVEAEPVRSSASQ